MLFTQQGGYKIKEFEDLSVAIIACGMRRDYVQPFFKSNFKPYIYYIEKGFIDFNVQDYDFIKPYNNWLKLLYLLIRSRPEIVIAQEPFFLKLLMVNFVTVLYCKLFKKKYVVIAIENIDPQIKYGKMSFFLNLFNKIYIRNATQIIALNNDAKRLIEKYSDISVRRKFRNVFFGVWGVDVTEFSPKVLAGDPDIGDNTILFVGRLIEGKGILQLIEAMQTVRRTVADARLFIVGNGPLKKGIEKLNKEYITIHGGMKNEDLPGYFRSARITSVPAITTKKWAEQVGMVNIQSIACGTPVVTTRSGSIPEYIPDGKAGLLVEEGDVQELANALIRLLIDHELNSVFGAEGRKLALDKYDADKSFKDFELLIGELSNTTIPSIQPEAI